MSYQVLARKWRPGNFDELIGQKQTSQALINALESQRLHHAYLFTGTRGVGKTTIARILSKSLNCENGITSKPCGTCSSCVEISQGNFVDLLEIDAASKTKVEDTRELLENVQYRPTRGRYKVYLIDEVHMLSGHSFNALLKTLEEPPPHVIFLLATTDPQKMPVTVLSRCLQFHLRRMEETEIIDHLAHILKAEEIEYEQKALLPIAKGADGSMRDALSLLDQAIAYSGSHIKESVVLDMLGSIDRNYSFELLKNISQTDPQMLMQTIQKIAEFSPDYDDLMSDWLAVLHQIAVCQATGIASDEIISEYAQQTKPADIQLYYQLSLQARKDLPFAPHPRQGFEMAMLRIIAFKPSPKVPTGDVKKKIKLSSVEKQSELSASLAYSEKQTSMTSNQAQHKHEYQNQNQNIAQQNYIAEPNSTPIVLPEQEKAAPQLASEIQSEKTPEILIAVEEVPSLKLVVDNDLQKIESTPITSEINKLSNESFNNIEPITLDEINQHNWYAVIELVPITGNGLQVLMNSLANYADNKLTIKLLDKVEILLTPAAKSTIELEFKQYYNTETFKVEFIAVTELDETPKERQNRLLQLAIDNAEKKLLNDPQVSYLIQHLDAKLARESIHLK